MLGSAVEVEVEVVSEDVGEKQLECSTPPSKRDLEHPGRPGRRCAHFYPFARPFHITQIITGWRQKHDNSRFRNQDPCASWGMAVFDALMFLGGCLRA